MDPEYHLVSSVLGGIIIYFFTGSGLMFFLFFAGGFLIDLDHVIDFWIYKKRITYTKEFFSGFHRNWGKLPILFHSIEFLPLLMILGVIAGLHEYAFVLVLGMLLHLTMDALHNSADKYTYFLTYRMINNFKTKELVKNDNPGY